PHNPEIYFLSSRKNPFPFGWIMAALGHTKRIAERDRYFYVNQVERNETLESGKDLGRELLEQLPEIDTLVACVGIGGTICGSSKVLKDKRDIERRNAMSFLIKLSKDN
ncbi:MAG: pyridoxal-phosphate dependent enzyme, partial [Candidatus Marinimicrobia bacterium]|nr:pyridoxal-phosphate dependent enzyme [Candidatus Neomarinimicrobiota bacterium]